MTTIEVKKDSAVSILCNTCKEHESVLYQSLQLCEECFFKKALEEFDKTTILVKG